MEPQPGSPPVPSSTETAEVSTPSVEMLPSDAVEEEAAGDRPDRRSSSSSSSSSSEASKAENLFHPDAVETSSIPLVVVVTSPGDEAVASGDGAVVRRPDEEAAASGDGAVVRLPDDEAAVASGDGAVVRRPDDEAVVPGDGPVVRPDDWASWPQQPPAQAADSPVVEDGGVPGLTTQAPEVQTMAQPAAEPAPAAGFDPGRIPASIFQAKPPSSSQAEWSVASNESLFSIHGARPSTDLCGLYAGESRSHFDYFYDEAMAAAGGADQPDWRLATVAEGSPGSGRSDASGGGSSDRAKQKAAIAFRRHESGSAGSSSNFSFAFPILPETTTSPRKREYGGGGSGMYQPLQKELEQQSPPPVPSFEEMTTEEERRRRTSRWCCCCGEYCGCCWFACSCSWSSCCCCRRWRQWWCCDCRCSCPTVCRCNWCLCA